MQNILTVFSFYLKLYFCFCLIISKSCLKYYMVEWIVFDYDFVKKLKTVSDSFSFNPEY